MSSDDKRVRKKQIKKLIVFALLYLICKLAGSGEVASKNEYT